MTSSSLKKSSVLENRDQSLPDFTSTGSSSSSIKSEHVDINHMRAFMDEFVADKIQSFREDPAGFNQGLLVDIIIESVLDPLCPECYIGLKCMNEALAQLPHIKAELQYIPYVADSNSPFPSIPWHEYIAERYPNRKLRIFNSQVPQTLRDLESHGIRCTDFFNRPIGGTTDALRLLKACKLPFVSCITSYMLFLVHDFAGTDAQCVENYVEALFTG